MSDEEPVPGDQGERLKKLEDQMRELQSQVAALRKRHKRNKRSGSSPGLRDALSGDVMVKTFGVLLLLSLLPYFGPLVVLVFTPSSASSAIPSPPWEVLGFLPGGMAVWMPLWQISILLTFVIGAVAFIAHRD